MNLREKGFKALLVAARIVGAYVAVQILRGVWWLLNLLLIAPPFDPLKNLPGPEAPRLANHFRNVMDPEVTPATHEEWVGQFGKTFRYHGFGAVCTMPATR
jgi:hypothetical protein